MASFGSAKIPVRNRVALAFVLCAAMIVAGWDRPWWLVVLCCLPWPTLVVVGLWDEYRG